MPLSSDDHKLHEITDTLLMGVAGDKGEADQFAQLVSKNIQLYKMRNSYELNTAAAVHFTRKTLVGTNRTSTPVMLNLLIGGFDEEERSQLYSLDMLGACIKVPFATQGLGGLLSMGIIYQYYKKNLTEAEAYMILKKCVHEIHHGLIISLPNFEVKVVSKSGIRELPVISPASFL